MSGVLDTVFQKLQILAALTVFTLGCSKDTISVRFPETARSGVLIACGNSDEQGQQPVVSFFVTASCRTEPPLEVRVENEVDVPIHSESLPLELIAGREEPIRIPTNAPPQSGIVTVEVSAHCWPKASNRSIISRTTCALGKR